METVEAYICKLQRASQPIVAPEFKVGGSPVFLCETPWPTCSSCRQEMDFLAQVPLQSPLAFSSRYAMAYIFMCPGKFDERGDLTCETWEVDSGANKVILQEDSGAVIPISKPSKYPDYSVTLEPTREPLIDTSGDEVTEEMIEAVHEATKLAGVPAWLQDNETPECPTCGRPAKFVAQLNAELDGPLPGNPANWDAYKFLDFGDAGIGYLFICPESCGTESGLFLWQCS